jgi:hypothetical protein
MILWDPAMSAPQPVLLGLSGSEALVLHNCLQRSRWHQAANVTITEVTVRELAIPLAYVDIQVCAVKKAWSGLKPFICKEPRSECGLTARMTHAFR